MFCFAIILLASASVTYSMILTVITPLDVKPATISLKLGKFALGFTFYSSTGGSAFYSSTGGFAFYSSTGGFAFYSSTGGFAFYSSTGGLKISPIDAFLDELFYCGMGPQSIIMERRSSSSYS